jgi:hypothetical protein
MNLESQMQLLFDVYYEQCNGRKISYTTQDHEQCWIVMDGIFLTYAHYNGIDQPMFLFTRDNETYHFKRFSECEFAWNLSDDAFNEETIKAFQKTAELIVALKDIDGDTLEYVIREVCMEDQILKQLFIKADDLTVSNIIELREEAITNNFNN